MTYRGRLTDAEAFSDDRGEVGLEQRRLVLRHGCLHSRALHHIDNSHVSNFIFLPALWQRDVQLQTFPAFARGPQGHAAGHAQTAPTSGPELPFHCFALQLVAHHGVCRAQRELLALYEPSVELDLPPEHDAGSVVHTLERLVAICSAWAFVHGRLDHAHAARAHTIYDQTCPVFKVAVEVAHQHAHGALPELQRVQRPLSFTGT